MRNAAIDRARRQPPRAEELNELLFDPVVGPRDTVVEKEFKPKVAEALLTFSADEPETIVQHIYGDLTFREIARARQAPFGIVAAWYHRWIFYSAFL